MSAYQRETLNGLTAKQRAGWERRAKRILWLTECLAHDVTEAFGVEHPLTDSIDSVTESAENLVYTLRPEKKS